MADTLAQAAPHMLATLKAIVARIDGVWDAPELLAMGALGDTMNDVRHYASRQIEGVERNVPALVDVPAYPLYRVCAGTPGHDDTDLYVRAPDVEAAVSHWRDYYEKDASEEPDTVEMVPENVQKYAGPIEWDQDKITRY